jgi:enoyl-CoA hydratase/carnithine racemase
MHMINSYCGVDRDPRGVVRLTICNAGPLNVLGSAAINAVREGLETLATDRQIRILILAGQNEKSLIGGADIKEMARLDQASAEKFISGLRDLCEAVRGFPVPVIARLPGWCLGGGLEVGAACDFRIAAHDAKFGMPEVKVGIPSVIHAALLPRLIGSGRARWLVMTAEAIDAPTALAWGLVDVVASEGGLDEAVENGRGSLEMRPGSLAFAKSPVATMGRIAVDGVNQSQCESIWAIFSDRRAATADAGFYRSQTLTNVFTRMYGVTRLQIFQQII